MENTKVIFVLFLAFSLFFLDGLSDVDKKSESGYNSLEIDMVKLAPYAVWNNYYGPMKLGHRQLIINSAYVLPGDAGIVVGTQYKDGEVRAKYTFMMPGGAEMLKFKSEFCPISKSKRQANVSIGFSGDNEEISYFIEKTNASKLDFDISRIAGKKVNLFLKTFGDAIFGSFIKWHNTKIIAYYKEKGLPDLAISPSDLAIKSIPGKPTAISAVIHNIATVESKEFKVLLFINGKYATVANCRKMEAKSTQTVNWENVSQIPEDASQIKVQIESNENENSKENNYTELTVNLPAYKTLLQDISVYPNSRKAEKLIFNIDASDLDIKSNYKLILDIYDYYDKKVESAEVPIGKDKKAVEFNLSPAYKIGWWKLLVKAVCNGEEIETLSTTFCRTPDQVYTTGTESIFHTMSPFDDDISLFKDTGASCWRISIFSVKNNEWIARIDNLLKNGIIPSCIVWPKTPDEAKTLGTMLARRYPHKTTKIWWEIWGESNPKICPRDYSALVRSFYEGASKIDPDVKVATMEMTHCQPSLMDDGTRGTRYEWLRQLYPQVKGYISAVGNNHYTHLAPEKPFYDAIVKPLLDIIKENGDFGKIQIHLQEGTVDGNGTGPLPAILVRAYLYQLGKQAEGAAIMDWFCLRDYWTPVSFCRNGMTEYNMAPKATYQAYSVMTDQLKNATFYGAKNIGDDNYCYFFKKDDGNITCIWRGKEECEKIKLQAEKAIKVTNIMGYTNEIIPQNGTVELSLSSSPLYISGLEYDNFKLLSRVNIPMKRKAELFEKEYKQASNIIKGKNVNARIYYNMARYCYVQGMPSQKIEAFIKEGISAGRIKQPDTGENIRSFYSGIPIKIDGDISEWKGFPVYAQKDHLFVFQTCWDKENVYFLFKVKDKDIVAEYPSTNIDGFGGDCIELYLDVLNKKAISPGMEFFQIFLGLNDKIGYCVYPGLLHPDVKMKWMKCQDGYIMETAIPLKDLFLGDLTSGCKIAFNIGVDNFKKPGIIGECGIFSNNGFISHTCRGAAELEFIKESEIKNPQNAASLFASVKDKSFSIGSKGYRITSGSFLDDCLIEIEDVTGILFYYRDMNIPDRRYYITGQNLQSVTLSQDRTEIKEIKALYSTHTQSALELDIIMKKGNPCLWISAKFKNIGTVPMNTGIEWGLKDRYGKFFALDKKIYNIPKEVGMEMTSGLITKENWKSIGISPYDEWIYFQPASNNKSGLGVLIDKPKDETSFFGIREDLREYWGEKRKILEGKESLQSKFILIPAKTEKEFTQILDDIKNKD